MTSELLSHPADHLRKKDPHRGGRAQLLVSGYEDNVSPYGLGQLVELSLTRRIPMQQGLHTLLIKWTPHLLKIRSQILRVTFLHKYI